MATNSMVPFSNRVGNNQTTPGAGVHPVAAMGAGALPTVASPTNPTAAATSNPLVPAGSVQGTPGMSTIPISAPATAQSTVPGAITSGSVLGPGSAPGTIGSTNNNAADTQAQLTDIYGSGVGTDLTNLLDSIGGTNSATLQEYIASLAPQEAQSQATLQATLGAGGVSANSSVAALGEANLQAQEFANISGESANLTQSGQQLEASLLESTMPSAQKEVATSDWSVFGDVMGNIAQDAGAILHGGSGAKSAPTTPNGTTTASTASTVPASVSSGSVAGSDYAASDALTPGYDLGESIIPFD